MENTMKMYVTADEVAELLGVSRGYIRPHQPRKKSRKPDENIWINVECRRASGGNFP